MEQTAERGYWTMYFRAARWTMLEGNRLFLAGGVTLGVFLLTWGLVAFGIISVGPRTPITSILGSGVVAGLFSLISVTLAINQLISSRIFGGLSQMENKIEGGHELRDTVAEIGGIRRQSGRPHSSRSSGRRSRSKSTPFALSTTPTTRRSGRSSW